MADIVISHLRKVFRDGTVGVEDLSLEVSDGEFVVLVGPSGCGKTTTLMIAAGLEEPTAGDVFIGNVNVTNLHPKDRDIAMVFQGYALYPHMTVEENIAFGLRRRRLDQRKIREKVAEAARILDLEGILSKRPSALSGGQRQRVAMGRALVRNPKLFLMDEPLSNLDAKLRVQMRTEIKQLQRQSGTTTLYVTHDQTEAMTMGDRVVVMRKGRIEQLGAPAELYRAPANLFVAGFIGSPAMNLVEAAVELSGRRALLHVGVAFEPFAVTDDASVRALENYSGKKIGLGFRPEHTVLHTGTSTAARTVRVDLVEDLGADIIAYFAVDAPRVFTEQVRQAAEDVDAVAVDELIRESRGKAVCVSRMPADTFIEVGAPASIAVDARHLHFFDLETGANIKPPAGSEAGVQVGAAMGDELLHRPAKALDA